MTDTLSLPVLALENISKNFGGKPAVSGVSFTVNKGEIVGFLGPNGAGKTTTLRIALGLISPDQGSARLFGGAPGARAFGRIGFLPEERGLYRKMTARNAIAYIARLNGMKNGPALMQADKMLTDYGLGDVARKKIKTLSKGMAQKVQLIAAIAHDPELLVLDEPFSGLDPVNQKLLEDLIREIAARGRTIIFSTHVMEHAERLCSKIIMMSGGRKIFDGELDDVLSRAPSKLKLATKAKTVETVLGPMCLNFSEQDSLCDMTLKPGVQAHEVLRACRDNNVDIDLFEPERPSLHEAFVAMIKAPQQGQGEAA